MKVRIIGALAALLMTTAHVQAAFDANAVAAELKAQGYTQIEIKVGQSIVKVEAIKDGQKVETTYDLATGDILKTETQAVGADGSSNDLNLLLRGGDDSDDEDDDNGGDDNGSDDDDGGDDDHGGHGSDDGDDGDDDHGGDDD